MLVFWCCQHTQLYSTVTKKVSGQSQTVPSDQFSLEDPSQFHSFNPSQKEEAERDSLTTPGFRPIIPNCGRGQSILLGGQKGLPSNHNRIFASNGSDGLSGRLLAPIFSCRKKRRGVNVSELQHVILNPRSALIPLTADQLLPLILPLTANWFDVKQQLPPLACHSSEFTERHLLQVRLRGRKWKLSVQSANGKT